MPAARDAFRLQVADVRIQWCLDCIPPRPDSSFERAVFLAALGEIVALRLRIAYMPLFTGLQRIENQLALLAAMREDPYAPSPSGSPSARLRLTSTRHQSDL